MNAGPTHHRLTFSEFAQAPGSRLDRPIGLPAAAAIAQRLEVIRIHHLLAVLGDRQRVAEDLGVEIE
jgi:hypothetical protein